MGIQHKERLLREAAKKVLFLVARPRDIKKERKKAQSNPYSYAGTGSVDPRCKRGEKSF